MRSLHLPMRWSMEELENQRLRALEHFIRERLRPPEQEYSARFRELHRTLEELFLATNDLRCFTPEQLGHDRKLLDAARYLASPPWSESDLRTVVGVNVIWRKRLPPDTVAQAIRALRVGWDPHRFRWVHEGRPPTLEEREVALKWTASIWAIERLRTRRRMERSQQQQDAVELELIQAGYQKEQAIRNIQFPHHLGAGFFTSEVLLGGTKCDVAVRLRDERLLAIECKVSNDSLNSVKRLIRESGGKAQRWRQAFGEMVIPAVVLAGVYKLRHLVQAQETYGLTIFWEHDLSQLREAIT